MKIGLVVEGGGMKCAYNAAILDAFLDHNITFAYCIGASGGSGNLASYLAGQRGRNLRFFTEHIHDPDYFGPRSFLKTGDLFGLQYIYGTLTNSMGKDPLDFPALKNNPAEYEVVVTNALTGKAEYFGKETMAQDDYRLIMASSAIPAACRPVELNDIPYFDGGLSDAIPVSRALEKGCDRLVVILSKTRDCIRKPQGMRFLYTMRCHPYPQIISLIDHRHIAYNKNLQEVFALEREGKAFVFAPSHSIHAGTYSMNEQLERDPYALGMEDFNKQKDALAAFMTVRCSEMLPVGIKILLKWEIQDLLVGLYDKTIFISSMTLYRQAMLLAIHFARSGLLGNSPIPCPSQKFLLRLRVLQMLFPALAVYLMYGPGPDLYEIQKEKSQVQRFHFL